jgi:hypothetical protein
MQASEAAGMPWGHVISTAGGGSVSVLGGAGGAPPAHGLDLGRDVPVYCVSNYGRRFLKLGMMMMMLGLRRKVCEMAGAAAAALNKCDSLLYLNRQCTDNRLSYVCTQCVLLLSPAADQKAIQRYTAAVSGRRNVTTCE